MNKLKYYFDSWTEEELSTLTKKLCTPPPDKSKMEWLKAFEPTK